MYFKQFYLGCLAHASYLIGDESTKTAVVVDPQRDIDQYLQEAESHGLTIRHVILTHFHADFISGHVELQERSGAQIYLGAQGKAEYAFKPLSDGETLTFGKVELKVLETPGHTPEAISILVYDLSKKQAAPYAVLTGDTLFIGDVGRPDLMASQGITKDELAGMLYDSLHQKLLPLPDETLVYPAHGAGSMCGKNLSKETFATLGSQRKFNYALQPMSKSEFIAMVTSDQPDAPDYFSYDAQLNKKERNSLSKMLEQAVKPLSVDDVLSMRDKGAQILDSRNADDYAKLHLIGSTNIGLGGQYATWCGTVLDREKPIVLIAEPGTESEAAMRLGRIGLDNITGYLEGGLKSLEGKPDLLRSVKRVTVSELENELADSAPPIVLDVRNDRERADSNINSSIHIPLNKLKDRWQEVPQNQRVVIHCARGYRSSIAASLLEERGLRNVTDLIGGMVAWEQEHNQPTKSCS
jgi:hydroxyacylglutathione hydrolase